MFGILRAGLDGLEKAAQAELLMGIWVSYLRDISSQTHIPCT
ncbi:hypothetical protein CPS_1773 [Colwellia psychrerythraea 34H]|uniref:Uncharacterized protein n=1 Tax=Colwellia psychrerythraea (strain 34H / ATCC BAA-681) TaxID=167879 RepID=Q484L1_COLP3|nr:hypothetical protein CPS_1773 [Colwellia psychrerythraea 34H]